VITIETARLILRMFREDDLEQVPASSLVGPPRLSSACGRTFVFDRS